MPIKSLTTLTTATTLEELVEDGRNTAIYLSPFPEQEKKKFSASDTNLRDDKSSDPGKVCPTRAIQGSQGPSEKLDQRKIGKDWILSTAGFLDERKRKSSCRFGRFFSNSAFERRKIKHGDIHVAVCVNSAIK